MNLRIELIKALVFVCLGVYMGIHFKPNEEEKSPQVITKVAQAQQQKCVIVQKTVKKPDGSSVQILSLDASDLQDQGIKLAKPEPSAKLGVGVAAFTDKSIDIRYELNSNYSLVGKCSDVTDYKKARYDIGLEFRF